jgi:N-methylhydantoinase A
MPAKTEATIVGIDVGGTFTDFIFLAPNGFVTMRKRPTTPRNHTQCILEGLEAAQLEGLIGAGFELAHGTTVATNALLERRGVDTALITTRGFRDVLEIGRQARENIYSLNPSRPAPLLPRNRRYEVSERIDWRGAVIQPLAENELRSIFERFRDERVESVAICFLFAHLNGSHERQAAEIAREYGLTVSLSSGVAPEPREYERTATTVANAYVAPILKRYLGRLQAAVSAAGASKLRVMQSNGGTLSSQDASDRAIKTALSGPAGGVIAAAHIAAEAGLRHLLTFDMGGTSTDVALVLDGKCPVVTLSTLGGMPLRTPMLDIHTVGAGGGSQAWLDSAGALRVGPQSAGADPGPAAYGASSVLTVTDANVFLGRIPSDVMLAGSVRLDPARVHTCFAEFAARMGRSPEEAALGIIEIAEASMARALRHISIERGHDPAGFALLSFGGAGGLHACSLAAALGITEVLVPCVPGAFSALGLAIAPIQCEFVRAFPAVAIVENRCDAAWGRIVEYISALKAEADAWQSVEEAEGIAFSQRMFLDVRYVGQSFEIRVPFDLSAPQVAITAFHALHLERYGHADIREPLEALVVRCVSTGTRPLPRLQFRAATETGTPIADALLHDGHGWVSAKRFERGNLAIGQTIEGSALVLQHDAAAFVPRDWQAFVDTYGNLRLTPR